ncbi:hypothetical protein BCR44DRAFT_44742, partial [Catenaria anguillulae PL171]
RSIGLVVCQSTSFAPSQLRLCQPSRCNLAATAQLWTPVAACANANALCTVVHKMYTHVSDADFAKLHSGFRDWFGVRWTTAKLRLVWISLARFCHLVKSPPQIFGQHLTTSPNRQALDTNVNASMDSFHCHLCTWDCYSQHQQMGGPGSFQETTRCIDDVNNQP